MSLVQVSSSSGLFHAFLHHRPHDSSLLASQSRLRMLLSTLTITHLRRQLLQRRANPGSQGNGMGDPLHREWRLHWPCHACHHVVDVHHRPPQDPSAMFRSVLVHSPSCIFLHGQSRVYEIWFALLLILFCCSAVGALDARDWLLCARCSSWPARSVFGLPHRLLYNLGRHLLFRRASIPRGPYRIGKSPH
jgi:hypothetical protein